MHDRLCDKSPQLADSTQVSFHDNKRVLKVKVAHKKNEIINRLEKTRQELEPDFKAEKEVVGGRRDRVQE